MENKVSDAVMNAAYNAVPVFTRDEVDHPNDTGRINWESLHNEEHLQNMLWAAIVANDISEVVDPNAPIVIERFDPTILTAVVHEGTVLGIYVPDFVPDSDVVMETLLKEIEWEQRETARAEHYSSYLNIPYTYGKGPGARTYYPKPYHPLVHKAIVDLENLTGQVFDVCFLNLYQDGSNHLGWHADDSPTMDPKRPIVTISLGAERDIWFRSQKDRTKQAHIRLASGSCFIMTPGLQQTHYHRIPKTAFVCNEPRISLTIRGYIDP